MISSGRPFSTTMSLLRSSTLAVRGGLKTNLAAAVDYRLPLAAAGISHPQRAYLSGKIGGKGKNQYSSETSSASRDENNSNADSSKPFKLPKALEKKSSRLPIFPSADLPPAPSEVHGVIEKSQKAIETKKQNPFNQFNPSTSSSSMQLGARVARDLPSADLPPHLTDRNMPPSLQSSTLTNNEYSAHLTATKKEPSHDPVIFYEAGSKCRIILNRPKQLNALNLSMIRNIQSRLLSWDKSPDMNAVIVKSNSERAFCAGGDVVTVARSIMTNEADDSVTAKYKTDFFREEYTMNHTIGQLTIPYIAIIDGITMGGGVGLSVHGKFRVATERTVFSMPETGIGFFPDVGGSWFLPRLEGGLGTFLALTGYRLKGQDVWHARIATHFCESSLLKELDQALLNLPVSADEAAICHVLDDFESRSLDDHNRENEQLDNNSGTNSSVSIPGARKSKGFTLHAYHNLISNVFENADSIEQIMQNLENSTEHAEWCRSVHDTMQKMSPTSLKVTLHALREGLKLPSLKECLKMEFRVAQRFCDKGLTHDFYEGVRALLIDKDASGAQWRPAKLENVREEDLVAEFFKPFANPKDELELN